MIMPGLQLEIARRGTLLRVPHRDRGAGGAPARPQTACQASGETAGGTTAEMAGETTAEMAGGTAGEMAAGEPAAGEPAAGELAAGDAAGGTHDEPADRGGIFAGDDPVAIVRRWLGEAERTEPNDPNAMALATVDETGMPNVRMVLLKEIEDDGFLFYTNYGSQKARELDSAGKAAFVLHWKSLRRQVRVRGLVEREDGPKADAYFASRSLRSRLGAWASRQSQPLRSRAALVAEVARLAARLGPNPPRPPFWGGYRIRPLEVEFWADGPFRLHDRFAWRRESLDSKWKIVRLSP